MLPKLTNNSFLCSLQCITLKVQLSIRLKEKGTLEKAWFYKEYGSIDVLHFKEIVVPKPGPCQHLIKIRVAALNLVNFKKREGLFISRDSDFSVLT